VNLASRLGVVVMVSLTGCEGRLYGAVEQTPAAAQGIPAGPGRLPVVEETRQCTGDDRVLKRLTNSELNAVFAELLGDNKNLADEIGQATALSEFFHNDRDFQALNNARVTQLEEQVIGPLIDAWLNTEKAQVAGQRRVIRCDAVQPSCVRQVLTDFGQRAWRRPLLESELAALDALAKETGGGFEGLGAAIKGLLLAPDFLFTIEAGEPQAKLDAYALASRLSFFLSGTGPDNALLQAAADGSLSTPMGYQAQVDRLLGGARAADHWLKNIAGNWLSVNDSSAPILEGDRYQAYQSARPSMLKETEAFVKHLFTANAPLSDIVAADYSFLDKPLGNFYGVAGSDTLTKTQLPLKRASGILSQAHLIGRTAGHANPILRGSFVAKRLACQSLTIPADFVIPPLPEPAAGENKSVRDILEAHTKPACVGCHRIIDPIGLALEELDEGAQPRSTYPDGHPVDATTTMYTGEKVTGVRGLGDSLKNGADFTNCAITQISAYAYGVSPKRVASDAVTATRAAWQSKSLGVKDLLATVAKSESFQTVCGAQQ
jgi:Protein of unknown function (DUF1592)/Protein of unknown function (DUF1588)/Protein of unknown function (DUF1595)/Protein of unknown function (DUF1585)